MWLSRRAPASVPGSGVPSLAQERKGQEKKEGRKEARKFTLFKQQEDR